ncbi:hypothetical protein ACIRS1_10970 [Kitasatospora sp. NPDC101176]|uniref:hypothetical protein n=1 Tax=Kitasatospora sp. NPDC101176 TaxID=3364099 RepID=UPI003830414F
MDKLLAACSAAERELELHARIEEPDDRLSKLDGAGAVLSHRPARHIPAHVLSNFDDVLRRTLEAWSVPSVEFAEFAEYDQYGMDVRAGSRPRSGRGQGVRSVLHSAFTTALARYCLREGLPHPEQRARLRHDVPLHRPGRRLPWLLPYLPDWRGVKLIRQT